MNSQLPVINTGGDYEETILRFSKHLGRDKNRRAVFDLIYGRGSRPRSKKQIAEQLGKAESAQVVQNALDELARHHLILRMKNDGQVKDGSRWVYGKDASVRANRDRIVRYADDPTAAKKVATKRHPVVQNDVSFVKVTKRSPARAYVDERSRVRKQARLKITMLVSNPERRASLQTGVEARYIDEGVRLGGKADKVDLRVVLAPTLTSVLDSLNSCRPDVLHFSGHGGGGTLLFDNDKAGDDGGTVLDFDMVARVVESTSAAPKLLVLVACDTVEGADRFLEKIPAVIAMADAIEDEAACEFSSQFYRSLSSGATIEQSLAQAKIVLQSKKYADADLPTLMVRNAEAGQRAFL